MKHFFSLSILFFLTLFTNAQTQFSGWLATFNTVKTGKKTSIHADFQFRTTDEMHRMQTLLLRTGLNYHITKKSTITAGYAFINNYKAIGNIDGYATEHRIWEQFIYAHKLKWITINHRFRLEQRFLPKSVIENNELKNDGTAYANRFRYFVRGILPFKSICKGISNNSFDKGAFAALQNEVFINFGNKDNVNGETFDQNRLYLALGYRFCKRFDIEAGYMNQYINGRNSAFINNHIVQIASYIRL